MWPVKRANTKTSLAQVNAQIVKTTQIPLLQAPPQMIDYVIWGMKSGKNVQTIIKTTTPVQNGVIDKATHVKHMKLVEILVGPF